MKPNCTACPAGTYSFGSSQCASCPAGAALVSATAGCAPSPEMTAGPADTAFYLSGTQAEGVSAFHATVTALYANLTGSFAPANAAPGLRFGAALWLSGDGQTAVAGFLSDNSLPGAMNVFTTSPSLGSWIQGPQLAGNRDAGDRFAAGFYTGQPQSIAISDDGLTAVGVASYWTVGQSGRSYIFRRVSAASQQWATISVNIFSGQPFGVAAMSGNGKFVMLGNGFANNYDGVSVILVDPGDGSTWPVQATLAPFPSWQRNCGSAGALNFDGSVAATLCLYGGVAIYKRAGASWALSYSDPSASQDPHTASLNAAGTIAAFGTGDAAAGYAKVLVYSPVTGTWMLEATFADSEKSFGVEVHLNAAGDCLVATRPLSYGVPPSSGTASVQVFQRLPSETAGSFVWLPAASVSMPSLPASAWFAFSAAISADGSRLLVGSPMFNSGTGAVWDFALSARPFHFNTGPFGEASSALALDMGGYLTLPGASAPANLPCGGNVAWSASAWVKCAPLASPVVILGWGSVSESSKALSLLTGTPCPLGWTQTFSSTCYKYFSTGLNWINAQAFCMQQGPDGGLASFSNSQDYSLLQAYPGSWIGVDTINRNIFDWVFARNGKSAVGLVQGHFCAGEPNNYRGGPSGVESCAATWNDGSSEHNGCLMDQDCSYASPYVCEIDAQTSATFFLACDSTWHHAALVYSPTATPFQLSAFLDGALVFAQARTIALPTRSASTLRVGWSGNLSANGGSLFAGALAEMRIYNRSLSPDEVLALSQPPLTAFPHAVSSPSVPTLGATSYTFSCTALSTGTSATLARSAADGSWAWTGGTVPACSPAPTRSAAPSGSATATASSTATTTSSITTWATSTPSATLTG